MGTRTRNEQLKNRKSFQIPKTPLAVPPKAKVRLGLIATSLEDEQVTYRELAERIYQRVNSLCQNCAKVKGWYTRTSKTRNGRKLSECLNPALSARLLFADLNWFCATTTYGKLNDDEIEAAKKAISEVVRLFDNLKSLHSPEATYSLNDAIIAWNELAAMLKYSMSSDYHFGEAFGSQPTYNEKLEDAFSRLALNYELEENELLQEQPIKTSRRKPHETRTYLQLFKLYKGVIITTQSKTKDGEPELDNNNKPKTFTGVVTDKHLTNCCFKQKAITTFKKYITLKYDPHIPRKRKRHDDVFEMMDTILRGKFSPIVKGSLLEDLGTAIFKELCYGEGSLSQRRKNGFRKFRDKHISVFDS